MIIWLPEKMNQTSANKLLKLIEEPPPKTLLLLVSLQAENILPTILSRTFQVKIPEIEANEMINELKKDSSFSEIEIQNIVKISGGSFSEALNNLEKNEENQYNFDSFQMLMRLSFKSNSEEILKWVEKMAMFGRERQKSFLQNGLRLVRENFIFNMKQPELQYMSDEEQKWSAKFSPFINSKNIDEINKEFNLAYYHIERNANSKIVFFDLALKLSNLIKK